jgi:hypothetical protein
VLLSGNWLGSIRIRVKWGTENSVKDELAATPSPLGRARAPKHHCNYQYSPCPRCGRVANCDGFHVDHVEMFGVDEAKPISLGGVVTDPPHFIRAEIKIYERARSAVAQDERGLRVTRRLHRKASQVPADGMDIGSKEG